MLTPVTAKSKPGHSISRAFALGQGRAAWYRAAPTAGRVQQRRSLSPDRRPPDASPSGAKTWTYLGLRNVRPLGKVCSARRGGEPSLQASARSPAAGASSFPERTLRAERDATCSRRQAVFRAAPPPAARAGQPAGPQRLLQPLTAPRLPAWGQAPSAASVQAPAALRGRPLRSWPGEGPPVLRGASFPSRGGARSRRRPLMAAKGPRHALGRGPATSRSPGGTDPRTRERQHLHVRPFSRPNPKRTRTSARK